MTVSLQAVLPTSQSSVARHLPTVEPIIGELISQPNLTFIGGAARTPMRVEIAVTSESVPLDFDFDAGGAPL
jgi:hypothetical protein